MDGAAAWAIPISVPWSCLPVVEKLMNKSAPGSVPYQRERSMDPSRPATFFDKLFDSGSEPFWTSRAAWHAQKLAWKAQRQAQRAAWRAQRDAQRAAWRAQWHAGRWADRGPFGAIWRLFWLVFWIGFGLLIVFSPEFRDGFIGFVTQIPKLAVHVLQALLGRAEI
jgi:hypothetical protein